MTTFSEDFLQKAMQLSSPERDNLAVILMLIDESPAYEDFLQKVLRLSVEERQDLEALLRYYDLDLWRRNHKDLQQAPLSPSEAIAQNLTGTWADLDLNDSVEWLNERKAKRQAERRW